MPHSDQADRGSRVVMILGIVTIVLFSANLLSMLSTRVWPRLQQLSMFNEEAPAPEAPTLHVPGTFRHTIVHFGSWPERLDKSYRLRNRLDADLERLERDIERETERLTR
jgi:hypothetical protein